MPCRNEGGGSTGGTHNIMLCTHYYILRTFENRVSDSNVVLSSLVTKADMTIFEKRFSIVCVCVHARCLLD